MHVLPVRFTSSNKKFYPKLQKLETDSTTNDFTAQVAHYTRPSHSKFARKHNSGELHHLTLRKCLASLFRARHSFSPRFFRGPPERKRCLHYLESFEMSGRDYSSSRACSDLNHRRHHIHTSSSESGVRNPFFCHIFDDE